MINSRDPAVREAIRYSDERVRESLRLLAEEVPEIDLGLSASRVAIQAIVEFQDEDRRRWVALARAAKPQT